MDKFYGTWTFVESANFEQYLKGKEAYSTYLVCTLCKEGKTLNIWKSQLVIWFGIPPEGVQKA